MESRPPLPLQVPRPPQRQLRHRRQSLIQLIRHTVSRSQRGNFVRLTLCPYRVFALYPIEGFFPIFQPAFKLQRFDRFKDLPELRTGLHSECDQIVAANEWRRDDWFVRELFTFAQEELVVVHHPMAACAIDSMELELLFKRRPRHKSL